ncbi:hypothetical protein IAD21_03965 [Abditibacteriota bacterium]|nr:hypothetical protein IAD21_03965 [Abditibacteriota bacterium]
MPHPILLAESSLLLSPSPSRDNIPRSLEAARLVNWRIFEIPPDFSQCESADNALAHVPEQMDIGQLESGDGPSSKRATRNLAGYLKSRRSFTGNVYNSPFRRT